jgi:hypothetical protein
MLKQTMWLLMLVWCAAAYAGGTIYKWVDEQGNVHYLDTPPPPGGNYQIIHKSPAPGQDPTAVMNELKKKVEAVDKARETQQQSQQQRTQQADLETKRAESCEQAKQNLEILAKSSHPIRTEADGKQTVLTEEQRRDEVQKNQKLVEQYCKKP